MTASKQQLRRDERRDAIIDAAREVFLAEGFGAASMSDIAARLGGSKGTLYNYFRSKEELFEAFVRRACDRFSAAVFDLPADEPDLRKRLTIMASSFLTLLVSPDPIAVQRLVVGEGERFPDLGRFFYETGPKVLHQRLAVLIQGWMEAGELRAADPALAAQQFKGLAITDLHQLRLWSVIGQPTAAEIQARAEMAVDTFLRVYRPD